MTYRSRCTDSGDFDLPKAVGMAAKLTGLKFGLLRLDATNIRARQALITVTIGKVKIFI